ncbi:unnamed protein product, partial [Polarella glacialis]
MMCCLLPTGWSRQPAEEAGPDPKLAGSYSRWTPWKHQLVPPTLGAPAASSHESSRLDRVGSHPECSCLAQQVAGFSTRPSRSSTPRTGSGWPQLPVDESSASLCRGQPSAEASDSQGVAALRRTLPSALRCLQPRSLAPWWVEAIILDGLINRPEWTTSTTSRITFANTVTMTSTATTATQALFVASTHLAVSGERLLKVDPLDLAGKALFFQKEELSFSAFSKRRARTQFPGFDLGAMRLVSDARKSHLAPLWHSKNGLPGEEESNFGGTLDTACATAYALKALGPISMPGWTLLCLSSAAAEIAILKPAHPAFTAACRWLCSSPTAAAQLMRDCWAIAGNNHNSSNNINHTNQLPAMDRRQPPARFATCSVSSSTCSSIFKTEEAAPVASIVMSSSGAKDSCNNNNNNNKHKEEGQAEAEDADPPTSERPVQLRSPAPGACESGEERGRQLCPELSEEEPKLCPETAPTTTTAITTATTTATTTARPSSARPEEADILSGERHRQNATVRPRSDAHQPQHKQQKASDQKDEHLSQQHPQEQQEKHQHHQHHQQLELPVLQRQVSEPGLQLTRRQQEVALEKKTRSLRMMEETLRQLPKSRDRSLGLEKIRRLWALTTAKAAEPGSAAAVAACGAWSPLLEEVYSIIGRLNDAQASLPGLSGSVEVGQAAGAAGAAGEKALVQSSGVASSAASACVPGENGHEDSAAARQSSKRQMSQAGSTAPASPCNLISDSSDEEAEILSHLKQPELRRRPVSASCATLTAKRQRLVPTPKAAPTLVGAMIDVEVLDSPAAQARRGAFQRGQRPARLPEQVEVAARRRPCPLQSAPFGGPPVGRFKHGLSLNGPTLRDRSRSTSRGRSRELLLPVATPTASRGSASSGSRSLGSGALAAPCSPLWSSRPFGASSFTSPAQTRSPWTVSPASSNGHNTPHSNSTVPLFFSPEASSDDILAMAAAAATRRSPSAVSAVNVVASPPPASKGVLSKVFCGGFLVRDRTWAKTEIPDKFKKMVKNPWASTTTDSASSSAALKTSNAPWKARRQPPGSAVPDGSATTATPLQRSEVHTPPPGLGSMRLILGRAEAAETPPPLPPLRPTP